jgi:hypothetical protein
MSRFGRQIPIAVFTVTCGCSSADSSATSGTPDAGPPDPKAEQSGLGDPKVIAKLRDIGLQASSHAGVPSPKTMVAVAASDEQAAEMALTGGSVPSHAPVYVTVITGGTFTLDASRPPGAPAPQGTVLTVTVEQATFRTTEVGLTKKQPDLDKIGSDQVDLLAQ